MFGPMMYLMPSLVRRSALVTETFGSFLSSSATIWILYFLPPMSMPPPALYMSAVVSAQYLLTRPHEAASPDITPLTPILITSCACTEAVNNAHDAAPMRASRRPERLFMATPLAI